MSNRKYKPLNLNKLFQNLSEDLDVEPHQVLWLPKSLKDNIVHAYTTISLLDIGFVSGCFALCGYKSKKALVFPKLHDIRNFRYKPEVNFCGICEKMSETYNDLLKSFKYTDSAVSDFRRSLEIKNIFNKYINP